MKTTKKHFDIFKKECERWQTKLGLINWRIYYTQEPDNNNLASCTTDLSGYVATVNLSTEWTGTSPTTQQLKRTALHEILHILTTRVYSIAASRYVTQKELDEAEHELVRTIEYILKNI